MKKLAQPMSCSRCTLAIRSAGARRFFAGVVVCPPCFAELKRETAVLEAMKPKAACPTCVASLKKHTDHVAALGGPPPAPKETTT